jgi:hypothetical protein
MIDFVTRYISAISLAVAAALSIFNIGYYWKIGLHFLGLADLTNLVYSAGLSSTVLILWGGIVALVVRRQPSLPGIIIGLAGCCAFSLWGIWHIQPRNSEPQFWENLALLLGLAFGGAYFTAWVRLRQRSTGSTDQIDKVILAASLTVTMFQAGMFSAAIELIDRYTYLVSTKAGVINHARILRSSSAGFLLSFEGKVMFIPQGEIRSVMSEPQASP